MHRRLSALSATLSAALLCSAVVALGYPEPSKSPIAWELKFESAAPRRVVVEIPGQPTAKAYWYVTYTVTNSSGQDVQFLPTFDWVTNEGKVVTSDRSIPPAVFAKIKAQGNNKLLENSLHIAGTLREGADQAKDGVAIWEEPAARLGNFSIFVTGLSGESTQLMDASGKPMADAAGKPLLLFKTLQMDFKVAGDDVYAGNDLLVKLGQKWVMR